MCILRNRKVRPAYRLNPLSHPTLATTLSNCVWWNFMIIFLADWVLFPDKWAFEMCYRSSQTRVFHLQKIFPHIYNTLLLYFLRLKFNLFQLSCQAKCYGFQCSILYCQRFYLFFVTPFEFQYFTPFRRLCRL